MRTISDEKVRTFVGRKVDAALNEEDGDISDTRRDALKRYRGEKYGNERDGYSKFTTREVMETIEWVLPSVLRVFLSGDKVVAFDAVGPEDEESADQETDVVNHKILKANAGDGFVALYSWFKDILMYPNGYIKAYVEEQEKTETEEYKGYDGTSLAMLMQDPEIEIISQESRIEQIEINGQMQPVELFDIECKRTWTEKQFKLESIPPEQCLVDDNCFNPNIDHGDFVCHRSRKSFTQLVQEGFDRSELERVGKSEDYTWNDENVSRLFYEDENPDTQDDDDESMREFWVHECYGFLDIDEDGLAEYVNIIMVGGEVFEVEEVSYQPMVSASAILMTHSHTGMSYTDLVEDLQELKTTLIRQGLDNVYKQNINRKYISTQALTADGATMDALMNNQTEYIPVDGLPGNAVLPEQHQSILGDLMPFIQYADDRTQTRTGVAPNNSLDPNVLQQSTEGAFAMAMEKANDRIEMLVRVLAETGMKNLMRKVHQLIKMHPDIAKTVKLRGQWVPVDPDSWRDRSDMTVNVGLGFNNKQQQAATGMQILQLQREAMPLGMAGDKELFHTVEKIVNAAQFGDVNQLFAEPGTPRHQELQQLLAAQQQQGPDPAMIVAEAQVQAEQSKAQTAQQKLQMEHQRQTAKDQAEMAYKNRELALKEQEARTQAEKVALERFKVEKELDLKETKELADAIEKLSRAESHEPGPQLDEMTERATELSADYTYEGGELRENG